MQIKKALLINSGAFLLMIAGLVPVGSIVFLRCEVLVRIQFIRR